MLNVKQIFLNFKITLLCDFMFEINLFADFIFAEIKARKKQSGEYILL